LRRQRSAGRSVERRAREEEMANVVGVRFRRAGRIELCDAGELVLELDDLVVVETQKGLDMARVVVAPHQVAASDPLPLPLRRVVRKMTQEDLRQQRSFRTREPDALRRCREKIERHGLPMKLLAAEYAFDGSRLTFYFSADGRVDFRDLVRDLAATFRTRIELRQVGPRDETKIVGGIGRCGRNLWCASWLKDFSPVSMKMAKNQDLPLTDSRLAGICGRLMCCLAYENAAYSLARNRPPCLAGSACSWGLEPAAVPSASTCPRYSECVGVAL
jgi:cell fate regulator YaaT (PSP1 superfamily)